MGKHRKPILRTQDFTKYPVCFTCYGRGTIDAATPENRPPAAGGGLQFHSLIVTCPVCDGATLKRSFYASWDAYEDARQQCWGEHWAQEPPGETR